MAGAECSRHTACPTLHSCRRCSAADGSCITRVTVREWNKADPIEQNLDEALSIGRSSTARMSAALPWRPRWTQSGKSDAESRRTRRASHPGARVGVPCVLRILLLDTAAMTSARVHSHQSNRATTSKVKVDDKIAFRGVLANPYEVKWCASI
jgi:hypothetical protein